MRSAIRQRPAPLIALAALALVFLVVLSLGAAASSPSTPAVGARHAPAKLLLASGKDRIRVAAAAYCVSTERDRHGTRAHACTDRRPRLGRGPALAVRPRARVRLLFGDNPRLGDEIAGVRAFLLGVNGAVDPNLPVDRVGQLTVRPPARNHRRWSIRLPRRGLVNAIEILVRFAGGGDATYLARLRPAKRIPEQFLCPARSALGFDARSLVGKTVAAAERAAARHGCEVRVVRRDGVSFPVTGDYQPDRIDVEVEAGTVTRVIAVG